MKKKINSFVLIGLIGTSVFSAQFVIHYGKALWGKTDIWWTPMPLALSLHETTNDFKIFLNGELLDNHVERGSLHASDKLGRPYRVVPEDIRICLNNWNKVKASFLHSSVYSAFFLGMSVTFLLVGLGRLIKKEHATPDLPAGAGS